ncbi:MAG: hypothetical protein ACOYWZ_09700 [Bacillota bacterium]
MKNLSRILFCLGIFLLFSPLLLYWSIHGDSERYIWLISRSFPFDRLGSAPFQLLVGTTLLLAGLIVIAASRFIKKIKA